MGYLLKFALNLEAGTEFRFNSQFGVAVSARLCFCVSILGIFFVSNALALLAQSLLTLKVNPHTILKFIANAITHNPHRKIVLIETGQ